MRITSYLRDGRLDTHACDALDPLCAGLRAELAALTALPTTALLDLFDAFAGRIAADERTRGIEGLSFLATWLRRSNIESLLNLNLNGSHACLDGFRPLGSRSFIKAQPAGLVCQWLAGNVPTLAFFSLVPSLLARNPTLVKLALPDQPETLALLSVLSDTDGGGCTGEQLLRAVRVVYFDYTHADLNEQMSLNADCKVMWGGEAAIRGITSLPRHEHCAELVFGPKYSIGVVGRRADEAPGRLRRTAQALARDVAVFDQRACSSPQTVFVEGGAGAARAFAGALAGELDRLPPKRACDPYTAVQIMNARARYGMDERLGLIQSGHGNDWTICIDPDVGFKDAVQSRTIFIVPVDSWQEIVPLVNPKIQTIGIDFGDEAEALRFAGAATLRGAVRCVRFGLMNVYESPWDGKLMVGQLVRWVVCKP